MSKTDLSQLPPCYKRAQFIESGSLTVGYGFQRRDSERAVGGGLIEHVILEASQDKGELKEAVEGIVLRLDSKFWCGKPRVRLD